MLNKKSQINTPFIFCLNNFRASLEINNRTRPIGIKAKIIETKNESHHCELGSEKTGNEKWSLGVEKVSPGLNPKLEILVANRNMDVIPIPDIRILIRW